MCYLEQRPSSRRRAAFHLILAGHRFSKARHFRHALHSYYTARRVYDGKGWDLAEDHINFTVGKLACQLDLAHLALDALSLLLVESKQSASQQTLFLREYISVWSRLHQAAAAETDRAFPLPLIDNNSLEILLRSDIDESLKMDNLQWAQLDSEVLMARRFGRSRGRSTTAFNRQASTKPLVVVDEAFFFACTVINPMHFDLDLKNITLMVSQEPEHPAGVEVVPIQTLVIEAQRSIQIQFQLTARHPGQLHIQGLVFHLDGVAGQRRFLGRGRRLNATRADKMSVTYGPDLRLLPLALPSMPLLKAQFLVTEEALYVGQVIKAQLRLQNVGSTRLIDLAVVLSHPELAVLGAPGDDTAPPRSWQDFNLLAESKPELASTSLEPGEICDLPVWLCGRVPGNTLVRSVFAYTSETPHKSMPYRLLRVAFTVHFLPGVTLTATLRRAPHHVDTCYLQLTAENLNLRESAAFQLQQVVCCAANWKLQGLCDNQAGKSDLIQLPAKVSTTIHFVLRCTPEPGLQSSAVSLGPEQPQLDMGSMPCLDFFSRSTSTGTTLPDHCLNDVRLLLIWSNADGTVCGQTAAVAQLQMDGSEPTLQQPVIGTSVAFHIEHPTELHHDFSIEP